MSFILCAFRLTAERISRLEVNFILLHLGNNPDVTPVWTFRME